MAAGMNLEVPLRALTFRLIGLQAFMADHQQFSLLQFML